jgi:GMP synthase-like glutamine amidotransferase
MKPVTIFRHVGAEGPGYLETILQRQRIPYQLIAIDQNQAVPDRVSDSSGLVFMGGSMSVNDPLPWIAQELALIRQARDVSMPVIGHCLGGQLISKALGGNVVANPVREIGWHDVMTVNSPVSAARRYWLKNIPARFTAFHWHGETFTLPDGADLLLTGQHCRHQAFAIDNMLAMQCHVEMTATMVETWSDLFVDQLAPVSETLQSREQIRDRLEARVAALNVVADQLYDNWIRCLLQTESKA